MESEGGADAGARIGLLYPTRGAGEDDFVAIARRLEPPASVNVIYFDWPDGVGNFADMTPEQKINVLRRLGSPAHLRETVPAAIEGREFDVAALAVSSASFTQGPGGVERQIAQLSDLCGRPATSTTAGFSDALHNLGIRAVALASVYHRHVADHFIACLAAAGVDVVSRVDADATTDRELGGWPSEKIIDLVRSAAHPDAEAVVLPETALHTSAITAELEDAAGVPVLTATQVTVWSALRALGQHPVAGGLGPLFR